MTSPTTKPSTKELRSQFPKLIKLLPPHDWEWSEHDVPALYLAQNWHDRQGALVEILKELVECGGVRPNHEALHGVLYSMQNQWEALSDVVHVIRMTSTRPDAPPVDMPTKDPYLDTVNDAQLGWNTLHGLTQITETVLLAAHEKIASSGGKDFADQLYALRGSLTQATERMREILDA